MSLGEKLQHLRADAGLSQEDLAERLKVSRQAVSKWELDKTVPDVKYIVALSTSFQVSTDYLLKETAPENRPTEQPSAESADIPSRHPIPAACWALELGNVLAPSIFRCTSSTSPGRDSGRWQ